jgi:hypothetical protein
MLMNELFDSNIVNSEVLVNKNNKRKIVGISHDIPMTHASDYLDTIVIVPVQKR